MDAPKSQPGHMSPLPAPSGHSFLIKQLFPTTLGAYLTLEARLVLMHVMQ